MKLSLQICSDAFPQPVPQYDRINSQYLDYGQGSYPYNQPPAQYLNYGQYPSYAPAPSYPGYNYGYYQPPYGSYPVYNPAPQYPNPEPKPKPREYHGSKETYESSHWDKTNSDGSLDVKIPRYPSLHAEIERKTTNEGTATKTVFKQEY
ncbi:hypothetical protein KQX54_003543 [Cotesia glomerata]|uniref:Uncharacterized protein n=1 Tax=Cotesia glomerata TaxID=32391 RepID=A0AAV7HV65_COTGL|nr:hypothetical protein KQX54_003543 [Cotesia glomerata]